MCYMMTATQETQKAEGTRRKRRPNRRVGVREMRQNLSVYLDRVKAGETLHITEYGQVVALLAPLPAQRLTTLERLVPTNEVDLQATRDTRRRSRITSH